MAGSPLLSDCSPNSLRLAVQVFITQPPPIFPFPSPATSLPGPCYLAASCSLCVVEHAVPSSWNARPGLLRWPPSSFSFRAQPPASCLLLCPPRPYTENTLPFIPLFTSLLPPWASSSCRSRWALVALWAQQTLWYGTIFQ